MVFSQRIRVDTTAGGTLLAQNTQSWQDGGGRRITQRYYFSCGTMTAGTYYCDGGTTVTASTGFPLVLTAGAAPVSVDLDPGESLYAITSTGSGTVAVLGRGA